MKKLLVLLLFVYPAWVQAAEVYYLHQPGEDQLYVVFLADGSTFKQVAAGQPDYLWSDVAACGTALYGSVPPWMAHCETSAVGTNGDAIGETAGVGYNGISSFSGATVDFDFSTNPVLWTTPYFVVAPGGVQQRIFANTDPSLGIGIAHAWLNGVALTVRPDASYNLDLSTPAPAAPVINTQPASQTVAVDAQATFTVAADSSFNLPLFTYQWKKDGTAISGATNSAFIITAAQVSDNGSYTCVVRNVIVETMSNVAALTVAANTPHPGLVFAYAADGRKLTATIDADGAAIGNLFTGSPPDIMLVRFTCWTSDSATVYRQQIFSISQAVIMELPGNTLMTQLDGIDSNGDTWEAALWNWSVPTATTDGRAITLRGGSLVFEDRPPEMAALSVPFFR
ncbi:MAG: immunoglobulin domain-containing protein [Patescibacteria group bacterium]